MLDRIFTQISKADVIVADMTGRNPNVFYEVGYAHALDKFVLLLTQDSDDIPFDLKHRQHTVYGGKIELLRNELAKRLQWAIAESKRRTEGASAEFLSVSISGILLAPGMQEGDPIPILGSVGIEPTTSLFTVPIQIRNDSTEILAGISHVYLFAEKDAQIIPGDIKQEHLDVYNLPGEFTRKKTPRPEPLTSFMANENDSRDGLRMQYRLPISFGALPPGAVEESRIRMMFAKKLNEAAAVYRLRFHTHKRFFDYRFRLKIVVTPQPDK